MIRFIFQVFTNSLAIFLADRFILGFTFRGDVLSFCIAGLVLGLINFFIKPILKVVSAPLIIMTLGLFTIIINVILLWVLEYLIPELTIANMKAYFWGVFIISAVNIVFGTNKLRGRKK